MEHADAKHVGLSSYPSLGGVLHRHRRLALACVLFSVASLSIGCLAEKPKTPDVMLSDGEITRVLVELAKSFQSGFGEREARECGAQIPNLAVGRLRIFEFKDVVRGGNRWPEFSFEVRRIGKDSLGVNVRTFDNRELQKLVIVDLVRLAKIK